MIRESIDTHQKALKINLDKNKYGTFAEIGAGQEVARWFFRVGGASGTIAKTISAYDMIVSDAIYGHCDRYVSRNRLLTMLDHEYRLLLERLREKRGATTSFFVYADTAAAQSYVHRDECHGWMGVRFQSEPGSEPSDIIIHVRMFDRENLQQQEAIGIMGVNLVYGAVYHHDDLDLFLASLRDGLPADRGEVDMIKFSGPAFAGVDDRLMSLKLVELGLAQAAMFTAAGEVVYAADELYQKCILVERGSFRPVTKVTIDMFRRAHAEFIKDEAVRDKEMIGITEMTLKNLVEKDGKIDHQDFLDRVDILGTLGPTVLVSNYGEFHRLAAYLFRYTKERIGIVMGVPTLQQLFDEKYYQDLEGGILESFGRLFKNDLRLYIYPYRDPATRSLIKASSMTVAGRLKSLYAYLLENRYIRELEDYDEAILPIFSRDALARIRANDASWETMVPPMVAQIIKERELLGYRRK